MDYYTLLGVNRTSSTADIKLAYKKLASLHHPDKGGDAEQFKRVQEAYETLGDPVKRQMYDMPYRDQFSSPGFGGPFAREHRQARNPDGITTARISLAQAHNGTDIVVDVGYSREVLTVPAGIHDGTKFRLRGKGPSRFKHAEPGDLIVNIVIEMPPGVHREGNNIIQEVSVNSLIAIAGGDVTVAHFTGRTIKVKIPAGTQQGAKLKLRTYGIQDPHTGFPGDMLVKVNLFTPLIDNPDHLQALNKIKDEVINE